MSDYKLKIPTQDWKYETSVLIEIIKTESMSEESKKLLIEQVENVQKAIINELGVIHTRYKEETEVKKLEELSEENSQLKYDNQSIVEDYEDQLKRKREKIDHLAFVNAELTNRVKLAEELVFNHSQFLTNYKKSRDAEWD